MEEVKVETKVEVAEEPKIPYKPKRFETSKIVLYTIHFISVVFETAIIYGWMFMKLENAHYMLTAVIGLHGTSTAFYSRKSLRENEIKLSQIYGKSYIPEQSQYGYSSYGGYGNGYQNTMPYGNDGTDMNGMG